MTRQEMVDAFSLDAVNKKGAVFDEQKLEWLNSQYINDLPPARIAALIRDDLAAAGLHSPNLDEGGARDGGARRDWYLRVIEALKARAKLLGDFPRDLRPFVSDEFDYRPEAVEKHLAGSPQSGGAKPGGPKTEGPKTGGPEAIAARMAALRDALAGVGDFTEAGTEKALRGLAEGRGEAAAAFIHPLRVALLGTAVSPGIFVILTLIGRDRALRRLDRLIAFLRK
jgi:glutamyl-tRNA synthetase